MIEFLPQNDGHLIAIKISNRITHTEIEGLTPMLDAQIEKDGGKIQLLLDLLDFEGWEDLHALWDHFILVKNHHEAVERIAVLGDQEWERRFAELAARFGQADVGYYGAHGREAALAWLVGATG